MLVLDLPFEQSKKRSRLPVATVLYSEASRPCPSLGSTTSVGQSLGGPGRFPKSPLGVPTFHHLLLAIRICGLRRISAGNLRGYRSPGSIITLIHCTRDRY